MTDYAINILEFDTKEQYEDFKKKYIVESNVDFNKIIEMPKEYKGTYGGKFVDDSIKYYMTIESPNIDFLRSKKTLTKDEWYKLYRRALRVLPFKRQICAENKKEIDALVDKYKVQKAKMYKTGKLALELLSKYGAADWWDWRVLNWEVPSNALDTKIYDKNNKIEFSTEWYSADKLVEKVCKKNKYNLTYNYSYEFFGENFGSTRYEKGRKIIK